MLSHAILLYIKILTKNKKRQFSDIVNKFFSFFLVLLIDQNASNDSHIFCECVYVVLCWLKVKRNNDNDCYHLSVSQLIVFFLLSLSFVLDRCSLNISIIIIMIFALLTNTFICMNTTGKASNERRVLILRRILIRNTRE